MKLKQCVALNREERTENSWSVKGLTDENSENLDGSKFINLKMDILKAHRW